MKTALLVLAVLSLSACGTKPKELSSPNPDASFPRVYPSPSTLD